MKRTLLVSILVLSILLNTSPAKAEGSYPPTADAHTDWTEPDYNTGSEHYSQLAASNLAGCVVTTLLWLKFDIPTDLATITEATLNLEVVDPYSVGTTNLQLRYSTDTTWQESSITWETQPELNPEVLAIVEGVTGGTTAVFSSAALAALANEHRGETISLVVSGDCCCIVKPVVSFVTRTKEHPEGSSASLTLAGPTAVTLVNFEAVPQNDHIQVTWETATELNNLGFNLYRSETAAGPWTQLNAALIPAQQPGSITGATYEWLDTSVIPNVTYFYRLEDVDIYGMSTFHGPVSATAAEPSALSLIAFEGRPTVNMSFLLLAFGVTMMLTRQRKRSD